MSDSGHSLPRLVELMRTLLGPNGCPWDREQTLESLRQYVIEEAHEVVDAIDRGTPEMLREELGDLLLQVVFQAALTERKGWFDIDGVVDAICDKLVRRHPWVFGDEDVTGASGAVDGWEAIKLEEKKDRGALSGVPLALPGLLRAVRIGEKASAVGYDWPDAGGPRAKIDEELAELDDAAMAQDRAALEHELGDLLFALATYGRKQGLDPEAALRKSLNRFSERFRRCERAAQTAGKGLRDYSDEELDVLWEQAKAAERA
ncbi:MAG: nucleoside triphosphate pyrophosphohydrolase [Myxococcales bacterium]|nr:nucleoside triphosphate pyrophosphohydrolase [Myxococcales bacterium]MDH3842972.1 nucleoside triphosphate pyrophosphohydrolase [Myxococcales bacterium]